jgi:HD-GYP domain-containing protein (c-di-GMP phosphodiesterase class II)
LTSSRSYRPAYSVQQALDIMRKEGGRRLDESMVSVFVQVVEAERRRGSYLLDHIPDDLPAAAQQAGEGAAE